MTNISEKVRTYIREKGPLIVLGVTVGLLQAKTAERRNPIQAPSPESPSVPGVVFPLASEMHDIDSGSPHVIFRSIDPNCKIEVETDSSIKVFCGSPSQTILLPRS